VAELRQRLSRKGLQRFAEFGLPCCFAER